MADRRQRREAVVYSDPESEYALLHGSNAEAGSTPTLRNPPVSPVSPLELPTRALGLGEPLAIPRPLLWEEASPAPMPDAVDSDEWMFPVLQRQASPALPLWYTPGAGRRRNRRPSHSPSQSGGGLGMYSIAQLAGSFSSWMPMFEPLGAPTRDGSQDPEQVNITVDHDFDIEKVPSPEKLSPSRTRQAYELRTLSVTQGLASQAADHVICETF